MISKKKIAEALELLEQGVEFEDIQSNFGEKVAKAAFAKYFERRRLSPKGYPCDNKILRRDALRALNEPATKRALKKLRDIWEEHHVQDPDDYESSGGP